jgi:uncharacterized protein
LLRPATDADLPAILTLNQGSVPEVTPITLEALGVLVAAAPHVKVVERQGSVVAVLIGLDERARYDSPNFLWFKERYDRFFYVDRVMVAPGARGVGVGTQLYADVEAHARQAGYPVLTCEVNSRPLNVPSMAFHRKAGFLPVGTLESPAGDKAVTLLVKRL